MSAGNSTRTIGLTRPALRRVRAGEPFRPSARVHNAIVDALVGGAGVGPLGGTGIPAILPQTGVVKIQNRSGTARERFDVLGIDGVLIDPDDREEGFTEAVRLIGGLPTPDHLGKFVVLLEPIHYDDTNASGIARAVVSGVTVARCRMNEPDHLYADIADGECGFLDSCVIGSAELLWAQTVTAGQTAWVVARLGVSQPAATPIIITSVSGTTWPRTYGAKLWRPQAGGVGPDLGAHNRAEAFYPTGDPDTWEDSFSPLAVGEVVAAATWDAADEWFLFDVTRITDAEEC